MKKNISKRNKIIKISLLALLFIILLGGGFTAMRIYTAFNKITTHDFNKTPEELDIPEDLRQDPQNVKVDESITNIALFGLDQQNINEPGRSDSIMILTIDKKHKKVKLSSIMRDSYVNIKGHGMDKLNHAYAFGGPELAIKTINENFHLNIEDYVTVNFFNMEKIVDALGGVELDIKKEEVSIMNYYIDELANLEKEKPLHIKNAGKQLLNGRQTVAYTRNRYSGNGDFERAERQRRVMTALMEKIKNAGITRYLGIVSDLAPYVATSIPKGEIGDICKDLLTSGINTIEQERFPLDGYCEGKTINGVWYLVFDIPATKDHVYKYIFEDIKSEPK